MRNMNGWMKLVHALPALMTAAAIFTLSSMEKVDLPLEGLSYNDLLLHGSGYFVFGLTLLLAARPWRGFRENPAGTCLALLALGMLYALSDELHQAFVPNRSCSLADFLADSAGLTLAMAARVLWQRARDGIRATANPSR